MQLNCYMYNIYLQCLYIRWGFTSTCIHIHLNAHLGWQGLLWSECWLHQQGWRIHHGSLHHACTERGSHEGLNADTPTTTILPACYTEDGGWASRLKCMWKLTKPSQVLFKGVTAQSAWAPVPSTHSTYIILDIWTKTTITANVLYM